MEDYGAISLIPVVVVLTVAIVTHRTIAAVSAGAIVAFLIADGVGFVGSLSGALLTVMQDENTGCVILV